MLLGSLCGNVYLLTIEKNFVFERTKVYLAWIIWKSFLTWICTPCNMRIQGDSDRGYTALGAQTKWPILMMNWYKKNNNLEKINYLIKPLTQLCLNVLRQTFDLRTKNKKRWIIDFISVHVYEFDHFTYIIAEVLWVSLNKAHSNRVPK